MRIRRWARLILCLGAVLAYTAGCASSPRKARPALDLDKISRKKELVSPGRNATGIGCGTTEIAALGIARKIAHFNLRSIAGDGSYKVAFTILGEVPDPRKICVRVEARAESPPP